MRKVAIVLVSLVVLLVIAVVALPPLLGESLIKPRVVEAVRDATGRELRIDGDIGLSVFPNVSVEMTEVALANAPGADPQDMVSFDSLELELPLMPAISRNIVVERLILRNPKVVLRQDAEGKGNWEFEGQAGASEPAEPTEEGSGEPPINDLSLVDVRIEGGSVSFQSEQSGQSYEIDGLNLVAALENLQSPLSLDGDLTLNGEAVELDVKLDTPGKAMAQEAFQVVAGLKSSMLSLGYDGSLTPQPVPGLAGQFDLDVGSVGELLAWLGQPLPAEQPDPGPLAVSARFSGDGAKATLEEAKITGDGLEATATGSFDGSSEPMKVALEVQSGMIDIDRYLPPPAPASEAAPAAEAESQPPRSLEDLLASIPDEPIDLGPLKGTEADVRVDIGGVKAMGYEVGPLALTLGLTGGVLNADLSELGLYGGNVVAKVGLDGSGDALDAQVDVTVDNVDVGALAAVAQPEGELPVAGAVSADLTASTAGASPRALVQALSGKLDVDLGGIDVQAEQAAKLSELSLALELPGLEASPRLDATAIYNSQEVAVAVTVAPLGQVMGGEPFDLDARVTSALVSGGYAGTVVQQPVPGLDGAFDLDIGSVGELLAWLEQPLPEDQPDPGPLQVAARFTGDGAKATLEEAKITGDGLEATASGSFDGSGEVKVVTLRVESGLLDIDRYLPPPAETKGEEEEAAQPAAPPSPEDMIAGLPDDPIDLSGLTGTNADVQVTIGGIRAMGYEVGRVALNLLLQDGVLTADLDELGLYGGGVAAKVGLDASGDALDADVEVNVNQVDVGALAAAAQPGRRGAGERRGVRSLAGLGGRRQSARPGPESHGIAGHRSRWHRPAERTGRGALRADPGARPAGH